MLLGGVVGCNGWVFDWMWWLWYGVVDYYWWFEMLVWWLVGVVYFLF